MEEIVQLIPLIKWWLIVSLTTSVLSILLALGTTLLTMLVALKS